MREVHLRLQDLTSQQERTLGSQPFHLVSFTCKDTIASGSVDYQFENVELWTLHLILSYIDELVQNLTNQQYSIITVIGIDYF